MDQKIPIAIIGVGGHGQKHARSLKEVEKAELVGVYDVRAERCAQVAAELGVRAFASLDEALNEVRAVSIVIPTTDHAAVARQAMARGVDVLLEKPITRTLAEADGLIEEAAARGLILQVGHVERFNPGAVAAKAETHRPLFFEIHRMGVFSPRSLDVDVVFDLMIHDLDLVLWMVGAAVREVRAVGLPVLSDKVDLANARVEFENGVVANLTASRASTERVRKFRFFQPYEYFSVDFTRRDVVVISVNHDGPEPQLNIRKLATQPAEPLQVELEAFVESVRSRKPPLCGGKEGRAALALAEQVMSCIEAHAAALNLKLSRAVGQVGES